MDAKTKSLRRKQIYKASLWRCDDIKIHGVMTPRRFVKDYWEAGILEHIKIKYERGY